MIDVEALGELLIDFAAKSTDAAGYPGMAYCGDGIVNDDGSLMVPAPYGTDGASHIDKYGHYYEAAFG